MEYTNERECPVPIAKHDLSGQKPIDSESSADKAHINAVVNVNCQLNTVINCPYCMDDLSVEEKTSCCAQRHVFVHLDCAKELGVCPAIGCELELQPTALREQDFSAIRAKLKRRYRRKGRLGDKSNVKRREHFRVYRNWILASCLLAFIIALPHLLEFLRNFKI